MDVLAMYKRIVDARADMHWLGWLLVTPDEFEKNYEVLKKNVLAIRDDLVKEVGDENKVADWLANAIGSRTFTIDTLEKFLTENASA